MWISDAFGNLRRARRDRPSVSVASSGGDAWGCPSVFPASPLLPRYPCLRHRAIDGLQRGRITPGPRDTAPKPSARSRGRCYSSPSEVRGPVLFPPCIRHRPFDIAGALHFAPLRVRAPHRGQDCTSGSVSRQSGRRCTGLPAPCTSRRYGFAPHTAGRIAPAVASVANQVGGAPGYP